MSKISKTVISPQHHELLRQFLSFSNLTLVGGTALALQIGHRASYDLDFVTSGPISEQLVSEILQTVKPKKVIQRLQSDRQYTAFFDDIKITVFQDESEFLHPRFSFDGLNLGSVKDIFATKLFILGKRSEWRDYVDIAFCLKHNYADLGTGLRESMKRYNVSEKWILEPMTYFDDLQVVPVEWLRESMPEDEVKETLVKKVKEYLRTL